MARMNDRIALVVGGAKGIGLATAQRLANEGAKVFLTGRTRQEVEEALTPGRKKISRPLSAPYGTNTVGSTPLS
jgi:NAD(P)-dependent dehydrogenase (short-subunit alcohol dehydrogenase family)